MLIPQGWRMMLLHYLSSAKAKGMYVFKWLLKNSSCSIIVLLNILLE